MLCSGVLAVLLVAANLFHASSVLGHAQPLSQLVASGIWSATPAVLLAGLVLASSLHGARCLLLQLVRLRRPTGAARSPLRALGLAVVDQRSGVAPLRAGWSDRGPPTAALAAF
jgi:hypothetical protein